ncbi:probable LRR receptor-like serine/threonine-protein kinase At3g47570 [Euphorbia lathyris]|uniref:probable LRR receptor-like serine/threonine-protein kinase At3g47570 n=1 Tax=Euphorbia lathyris TaxID=212925 RepID=UPI003313467D
MVILFSFNFHFATPAKTNNLTDISALLALKSQFSLQPNHTLSYNWTLNSSVCDWIGVSCSSRHNRVSALNLSFMDLQGTISPYIGNLSFLTSLNIQNNSFHGQLPETIGRLRRLKLIHVRRNLLGGSIPPSLALCKKLESIYLGYNNFEGTIPDGIGDLSVLEIFQVRNNHLTGAFPSVILNISTLRVIDITYNNLVGDIPDDICFRLPKLQLLFFAMNPLGGQIPTSLSQCKDLTLVEFVGNRLTGSIPSDIGNISQLDHFNLGANRLTGVVPSSLGNLSRLFHLELRENNLWGEIPADLAKLYGIQKLIFTSNNLSGRLPQYIFNFSSALEISFAQNHLTGNIPELNSLHSLQLQKLFLSYNRLDGRIPVSISNASQLTLIELSNNSLSGQVPSSFGNLHLLETLNFLHNQLTGDPSQRVLHFLTSLTNCRNLINLVIGPNPLNGELPNSVGNLSSSLRRFVAFSSPIKGSIPPSIGNMSNLLILLLYSNNLTGVIPPSIGNLSRLQRLHVYGNNLEGRIPTELCRLPFLGEFLSHGNQLTGPIPDCIGNLSRMLILTLSSNAFESIPITLWSLSDMWFLDLSNNSLHGHLPPDIEKLTKIELFDLSKNQLSGNIPASISNLQMLKDLRLSNNSFEGSIPEVIGKLGSLEILDLSSNNFSGAIPKSLVELSYLKFLNLSYNELSGEIPSRGIFKNLTVQSFLGNLPEIRVCQSPDLPRWRKLSFWLKYIFPPVVAVTILVIFVIVYHSVKNKEKPSSVETSDTVHHRFITYNELVHATNNFNEENLLGVGSFGSVYKGTLSNDELIAVKVFNMESDDGFKSFDRECDVLRNVRHRNLLKIISSCSNLDFRALIFPFMPNGNLETLLYSEQPLDFLVRINIMIDVALGIEYLHHGYSHPVVHCDLKPNNVVLDEEMVAHVGDFGIAKILAEYKSMTLTGSLGTVGYIAPEYGMGGKVSTKGDVYSYGIMLIEIFTRKRPTDEMFGRGQSLRQWVIDCFPEQVMEIVDANLFIKENRNAESSERQHLQLQQCLSSIIELALLCSSDSQEDRPNMENVVARLTKIKQLYF